MRKHRFHFIFAACLGLGAILLYGLLFIHEPATSPAVLRIFQNAFAYINIIPLEVSAYSQNYGVHIPYCALVFVALMYVQWFAVGLGVSFLFRKLRCRNDVV